MAQLSFVFIGLKCRYVDRIAMVSSGRDDSTLSNGEAIDWICRIQQWDSSFFTISHVPSKYRRSVSKFLRRVIIARMAECPELASKYHSKLEKILDEAERKLSERTYLVGEEFSLADAAFVPVLSRLAILDQKVIGKYFDGFNRHITLLKTWLFLQIKSLLKQY